MDHNKTACWEESVKNMKLESLHISAIPERDTMAKTSRDSSEKWLPFWMHSLDTEAVMAYLLHNWVSKAEQENLRTNIDGRMSAEEMYQTGRFLALTHDIGKVTMDFQDKITRTNRAYEQVRDCLRGRNLPLKKLEEAKPHALLGQWILLRDWEEEPGVLAAACIIGAHHGRPAESPDGGVMFNDPGGQWQRLQEKWLAYALEQSGFSSMAELPPLSQQAQVLWTGLLIMADWIASNTYYFPLIPLGQDGRDIDYRDRVRKGMDKLHLTHPWMPEEVWDSDLLYQERFGFHPNAVQDLMAQAVSETDSPGIFILEAQMGVGKTEAALCAAEAIGAKTGRSGVFFGLPTQATANGIFPRLKDWAAQQATCEEHTIRLAHGGAALNEEYAALLEGTANTDEAAGGVMVNEWFSGRKQALLADFVVGTVDQLLMAGLKQKHVLLRHLGLGNKIVIVDECHAYDAYMNQYLEAVLRWLGSYHVPVILLSATLPADRRRDFILAYQNKNPRRQKDAEWMKSEAYPLLTWTEGENVLQRTTDLTGGKRQVRIELPTWPADDFTWLAQDLQTKLQAGGCAAVIVNTVRRAQACAAALRTTFAEDEIRVIHAQYLMPDRAERERQLVAQLGKKSKAGAGRPYRLIVVGTQVLEQSLDIDFDYMVTDLCPMDLLLQRIGRLHRHSGRKRPDQLAQPRCQILCADGDLEAGAKAVYGAYLLLRTRSLLRQREEILLPSDISTLVQATYGQEPMPDADELYEQAKQEEELRQKDQKRRANVYCIAAPDEDDPDLYDWLGTCYGDGEATAAVRDGDPSVDVLCLRWGPGEKLYLLADEKFQHPFSANGMPSEEEAREIARQKLRLPHGLCVPYRVKKTIEELEEQTQSTVAEWWSSPWLRGELFLLFTQEKTARIGDRVLRYSWENGLEMEKEEL